MISIYLRELMTNIDLTPGIQTRTERSRALEDRLKFETLGILNTFIEFGFPSPDMADRILESIDEANRNEYEAIREGYTIPDMVCGECGESNLDNIRVGAGMKCGMCAYPEGPDGLVQEEE